MMVVPVARLPPLFTQFPATLIAVAVPAAIAPAVRVSVPLAFNVASEPAVVNCCPDLFTCTLLNVCVATDPLIVCVAELLLKLTVELPGLNAAVLTLFVQFPKILMETAPVQV